MVDKIWYNMEELIGGSEERGINRNILECKVLPQFIECKRVPGINRNILECKGRTLSAEWNCKPVLIETYWNVKKSEEIVTS